MYFIFRPLYFKLKTLCVTKHKKNLQLFIFASNYVNNFNFKRLTNKIVHIIELQYHYYYITVIATFKKPRNKCSNLMSIIKYFNNRNKTKKKNLNVQT